MGCPDTTQGKALTGAALWSGPLLFEESTAGESLKYHSPRNNAASEKTGFATKKNPKQSIAWGLGKLSAT